MSKKNLKIDWFTTADIINNSTDEEIEEALKILNPSGKSAGEEVEEALKRFQEMGLIPYDDEDEDNG